MIIADVMMQINQSVNINPDNGHDDGSMNAVTYCKKLLMTLYPTYKEKIDPMLKSVTKDNTGKLLMKLVKLENEIAGPCDVQYIHHEFEDPVNRIVIFTNQGNYYNHQAAYVNFMKDIEGTRIFNLFMDMFSLIELRGVYLWQLYYEGIDNYLFGDIDEEEFISTCEEKEEAKRVFRLLTKGYPQKLYKRVRLIKITKEQFKHKLSRIKPKNLFENLALDILKDCLFCIYHEWTDYIFSMQENYESNPITPNETMRFQWEDPSVNELYNNYFDSYDIYWEYFYNMTIIDMGKNEPQINNGDEIVKKWIELFETWNERITNMMNQWTSKP